MPPETDHPVDVRQQHTDVPPQSVHEEAIPGVGVRPEMPFVPTDVTQYGFAPADTILGFGPGGTRNGTGQDVADVAREAAGESLWKPLHPDGWPGDDPGRKGGLGCTASVSEALRRAGVFAPDEDITLASQLQETLTGPKHNWQTVGEWPGGKPGVPADQAYPSAADVKPGDVIIGYRKGDGNNPSHGGNDAHAGIVGTDAQGNLVVYSNKGVVNGEEVWEATPYEEFVKRQGFSDGVVVMRAPANSSAPTAPTTR